MSCSRIQKRCPTEIFFMRSCTFGSLERTPKLSLTSDLRKKCTKILTPVELSIQLALLVALALYGIICPCANKSYLEF
jgi:hypothetical protein